MIINLSTEILPDKGFQIEEPKERENENDEIENEEENAEDNGQNSDQYLSIRAEGESLF